MFSYNNLGSIAIHANQFPRIPWKIENNIQFMSYIVLREKDLLTLRHALLSKTNVRNKISIPLKIVFPHLGPWIIDDWKVSSCHSRTHSSLIQCSLRTTSTNAKVHAYHTSHIHLVSWNFLLILKLYKLLWYKI